MDRRMDARFIAISPEPFGRGIKMIKVSSAAIFTGALRVYINNSLLILKHIFQQRTISCIKVFIKSGSAYKM